MGKLCTLMARDLPHLAFLTLGTGTLIPLWASSLASGSWVLARIYDPELLFISSGSKRFGWEVFQFPPGLDQTAQISKGEIALFSWVLCALGCIMSLPRPADRPLQVLGGWAGCPELTLPNGEWTQPHAAGLAPLTRHRNRPLQTVNKGQGQEDGFPYMSPASQIKFS